ncbi:MAG: hypothetical protein WBF39_09850 [Planococcus donghaensis]
MKYIIVSMGLFISAAIMFSAAYIASAIINLIVGSVGQSVLTSQTQVLYLVSIVTALAAVVFFVLGYFKKE